MHIFVNNLSKIKNIRSTPGVSKLHRGMTLIEIMVVVVVISIIAAFAYPSYVDYIARTQRAAAAGCIAQYVSYMERFYTTNLRYDQKTDGTSNTLALAGINCTTAGNMDANYTIQLANALTQTSYKIEAVPLGAQASRDTECATISIDETGVRTINGTGTAATCW